jgi:hypothetical protein
MESVAALPVAEALLRGGHDDERRAGGYAAVLEKLSMIKAAVVPPDAALMKKLSVLRLRTSSKAVPTTAELCGTSVTVDMAPPIGPPSGEKIVE